MDVVGLPSSGEGRKPGASCFSAFGWASAWLGLADERTVFLLVNDISGVAEIECCGIWMRESLSFGGVQEKITVTKLPPLACRKPLSGTLRSTPPASPSSVCGTRIFNLQPKTSSSERLSHISKARHTQHSTTFDAPTRRKILRLWPTALQSSEVANPTIPQTYLQAQQTKWRPWRRTHSSSRRTSRSRR